MVLAMGVLAILSPAPLLVRQRKEQLQREGQAMPPATERGADVSDDSEKTLTIEERGFKSP